MLSGFPVLKAGKWSIDDQTCSGCLSMARTDENVKWIREIILEDRRWIIEEVEKSGVTWSTENYEWRCGDEKSGCKICSSTADCTGKQGRVKSCSASNSEFQNDLNFFFQLKFKTSQWKTPNSARSKKARQMMSNIKTMLIYFFDVRGVIYSEFVPPNQIVNQAFYL